jgi:hypothetical protein
VATAFLLKAVETLRITGTTTREVPVTLSEEKIYSLKINDLRGAVGFARLAKLMGSIGEDHLPARPPDKSRSRVPDYVR